MEKTEIFFIDPQKTKVNQKTYIDFFEDVLAVRMPPTVSGQ